MFKELGLDQAGAQKLVDFVTKLEVDRSKVHTQLVDDMRAGWRKEFSTDSEMGSKAAQITTDIGRAKDVALGPPNSPTRMAFDAAMNLTGAGDHPAIIRGFWKLAQQLGEGTHVSGGGPSKEGQTPSGKTERPDAAHSLFPNLA